MYVIKTGTFLCYVHLHAYRYVCRFMCLHVFIRHVFFYFLHKCRIICLHVFMFLLFLHICRTCFYVTYTAKFLSYVYFARISICMYVHMFAYLYIHICGYFSIHTYIQTYIHTYIHTYTDPRTTRAKV